MAYLAVSAGNRGDLLEAAERRWTAIRAARPDLAPALDLQRTLLTLVVDLEHALDAGGLPRLSLPAKYLAAKLARGVPIFCGEPIPLPVPVLTPVLQQYCEALAVGDGFAVGDAVVFTARTTVRACGRAVFATAIVGAPTARPTTTTVHRQPRRRDC